VSTKYCSVNQLGFRNGSTWIDQNGNMVSADDYNIINQDGISNSSGGARFFVNSPGVAFVDSQYFELTTKLNPSNQNFWISYWTKPSKLNFPIADPYSSLVSTNDAGTVTSPGFNISRCNVGATPYLYITINDDYGANQLAMNFEDVLHTVDVWKHIVVIVRQIRPSSDRYVKVYQDGVISTYQLDLSSLSGQCIPSPSYPTRIGNNGSVGLREDGALTKIAYGSYESEDISFPSPSEILELYNEGVGKKYSELSPSLAAKVTHYWDCDEESGNLLDAKGNNIGIDNNDVSSVDGPASIIDSTYITQINPPRTGISWESTSALMPNGGLSFSCNVDQLSPITQVTRAKMNLRMSLPTSGLFENARDTFEINGYNARFKEQDYKDEMPEEIGSIQSKDSKYGYFIYGAGSIVEQSGFQTYTTELNFLNPELPNGDISSTIYKNIDIFNTMEFQLVGLPSGVQISAAQLELEYIPDDTLPLFIVGELGYIRKYAQSYVDVGGLSDINNGNGGWHHRGSLHEGAIFDAFYEFSEPSGKIVWPKSFNAASGSYGEFVNSMPASLVDDIVTIEPQRRNYYRNPVITGFSTSTYNPTYYRDMIYNGSPFLPWDIHNPNVSIYSPNTSQIYFGDRIVLNTDLTLYFMLYREPTNDGQSYGRIFHRGLFGSAGETDYEIIGSVETEKLRFTVSDRNNAPHAVEVTLPYSTLEPILVWFTIQYLDGTTTCKLAVHTDIKNYFSRDWNYDETSFIWPRKQYTGAKTIIGALWTPQTADDQLTYNSFLSYLSIVEFGWADSYIELDYTTSSTTTITNYSMSTDVDKRFFSSRVCNPTYLLGRLNIPSTIGGEPILVTESGWCPPRHVDEENEFGSHQWRDLANCKLPRSEETVDIYTTYLVNGKTLYGSTTLFAGDFDFHVPNNSIIKGIEVKYHVYGVGYGIRTDKMQLGFWNWGGEGFVNRIGNVLAFGGAPAHWENPVNIEDPLPILTYGGPTELWGTGEENPPITDIFWWPNETLYLTARGLIPSVVNNPDFGILLNISCPNIGSIAYIDYVEAKVYTDDTYLVADYDLIKWEVPTGSGGAVWSTIYNIDDWSQSVVYHSLYNPVTTAGTHNIVHPSAIYVEIETQHNTNHPSGAYIFCDIEFDSGATDNWKVFRSEFNIPSGELIKQVRGFSKHIGMGGGPVRYSDIDSIDLKLTTTYPNIDSDIYYGSLDIKSIKVYFDSFCVSTTGINDLDLYTHGIYPIGNSDIDLFTKGLIKSNSGDGSNPDLDLYIYGLPHTCSGNIVDLYTLAEDHYHSTPNTITLFVEAPTPVEFSGSMELYTWGTPVGVGGIYASKHLFTSGIGRDSILPLYMSAPNGISTNAMNLYLESYFNNINNDVDLVIFGPSGINSDTTYLYIKGLGSDGLEAGASSNGYTPSNTRMPLFMARDSESVERSMSLYLAQNNNINTITNYICGCYIVPSSIPLYIYGSGLPETKKLKLYTHGY
jgi:hypothetical protein